MENELDQLFNEENIPESNFFKWEKVGDKVAGTLVEVTDQPAKGVFPPSRVYTLKQSDESLVKVSFALSKDYIISRMNTAKLGDMVGFQFKAEIPSATKGFAPAKSIEVYVKHVENSPEESM